ncbi:hypothetical protein [Candidatus Accumulibacter sp. ACC003]|uniref:hypothetical protein n=1 Tax=Candidatus Accumulibacter sp. ACC003 TaxID=2823334 RepID=UPI0025C3ECA3|nr:hypothetical protein [Candidatus Accumulibacter sp. ACC003]
MSNVYRIEASAACDELPPEGTRRVIDNQERVLYDNYWIKTYPVPADSLLGKKSLIEALARRLFNHTEHGLNIPGCRLGDARQSYQAETNAARRRVKAGMLAGALFNRATDIFRRLVELQADGVEIRTDNALMRECGQCLLEAMDLGRFVLHRSGEEGIDELWGEPFRAFSIPIEDFYENRYIKIGQSMRAIDRIADAMVSNFGRIPTFESVEAPIRELANAARTKVETLRTDADIFDVWSHLVTAGERLADFTPQAAVDSLDAGEKRPGSRAHSVSDGVQLLRKGRDLIFYIVRARTPMPKSTGEYIERCEAYLASGRVPFIPATLPA